MEAVGQDIAQQSSGERGTGSTRNSAYGQSTVMEAILAEYESLRQQIFEASNHHTQIISIWIPALMALAGAAFISAKYDVLLIAPWFAAAFAYKWISDSKIIQVTADYLLHIERDRIPVAMGSFDVEAANKYEHLWIGWQHYWLAHAPKQKYHRYTILILFLVIPFGSSMLYSSLSILHVTVSSLPFLIHVLSLFLNTILLAHVAFSLFAVKKPARHGAGVAPAGKESRSS